jgi:RHS repeat-associated protein
MGSSSVRFPGQYFDEETGLHYNYFRDYDAERGRYIQPDPIGTTGGLNLFLYADANPVVAVDPFGLVAWTCRAIGGGRESSYRGTTKVCQYACSAKCYPSTTFDAPGWKSSYGSHCWGQEVGTQLMSSGQLSDNPIGAPKAFEVETEGVQRWIDRLLKGYPDEFFQKLDEVELNKSSCCK